MEAAHGTEERRLEGARSRRDGSRTLPSSTDFCLDTSSFCSRAASETVGKGVIGEVFSFCTTSLMDNGGVGGLSGAVAPSPLLPLAALCASGSAVARLCPSSATVFLRSDRSKLRLASLSSAAISAAELDATPAALASRVALRSWE